MFQAIGLKDRFKGNVLMLKHKKKYIIISASSDIGQALAEYWLADSENMVIGTYRSFNSGLEKINSENLHLVHCDLQNRESISKACEDISIAGNNWDVLVLAPGTQDPIGRFNDCNYGEWRNSIDVNFLGQLEIVHRLLESRSRDTENGPIVLFFAGGGTNNATINYSAYTISKIGLIKMCELLDAEISDTRFSILGPGWVNTKIHQSTLNSQHKAGENYNTTTRHFQENNWVSLDAVIHCCNWIISSPREIVSGRNFSLVFDRWGTEELNNLLISNPDYYKLRRFGNNILVQE